MQPIRPSIFAHPLAAPLASALFAIILFFPVTGYDYVYDSLYIIQRDKRLADPWFGLNVWTSQWWQEGSAVPLSRPLPQFTFWLQTQLHGNDLTQIGQYPINPFLVVDLLLYASLAALVAHLTRRWLSAGPNSSIINHKSSIINSYLVGLAFAVHPVHTEVVASTVGRADNFALLFTIIGILLWLRWRLQHFTWLRASLIGLCILAAGLSKESGYLLAPILIAVEIALRRRENCPIFRRADIPWRIIIVFLAVILLAIAQREVSKRSVEDILITNPADIDNPLVIASPAQHVITPFKILGHTLRLLTCPLVFDPRPDATLPVRPANSPDYSPRMLMPTDDLADPLVLLGLAAAAAWLLAVFHCWKNRHPALGPLLVLPIAWAIPSNTFLIIGTILGERLILPLSCFALIAAAALIPWHRFNLLSSTFSLLFAAFYILFLAFITFLYLPAWQSSESLQAYTVGYHPLSGRFQGFWAVSLLIHGMQHPQLREDFFNQAEHAARLALEYWPRNDQPYSVLGVIQHYRGNEQGAQKYLQYGRRGVSWNISDDYLAKIGQAQQHTELSKRADDLQSRLDADPDNKSLQLQLANAYTLFKQYTKALRLYEKSVDIDSQTDFALLEQYLEAALARGTAEQVEKLLRRQLTLRPDQWSVLTDAALIVMFNGKENLQQARLWLQRAAELSPGSPEPWAGLSLVYEIQDDRPKALQMLEQALLRSSPDDPKWVHYQLRLEQLRERYKK